jgi:hypothetical protein
MLIQDVDYYLDEYGNLVFTEEYHLKRGHCCTNKCRHCPWKVRSNNYKPRQKTLNNGNRKRNSEQ